MKLKTILAVALLACTTLTLTLKLQQRFPKIEGIKKIEVKNSVTYITLDDGAMITLHWTRAPTVEEIREAIKLHKELIATTKAYDNLSEATQIYNNLIFNKTPTEIEKASKHP